MENPKFSDCASVGIIADGRLVIPSTTVNGRSHDTIPLVHFGPTLERPGSLLVVEIKRYIKRIRGQEYVSLIDTISSMELEEGSGMKEVPVEIVDLSQ
ncbi:hypothetical protein V6N13_053956 [Hibiscus sabdariffa]|uniref:Uncharacterized protein n=1 Tax=Hibiscus sabdariffa TaxID=183260 RepID=A0ABR2T711_9ROSI